MASPPSIMFDDRTDAGHRLADVLDDLDVEVDIALAIPRGGLPVGRAVADRLGVPLDIVSARKIGAPRNAELAIGAVASDGTVWLNDALIDQLGVEPAYIEEQTEREHTAARLKVDRYRAGRPPLDLTGRSVLIVDDGLATGATALACVRQVRAATARRVTVAVPVAPPETVERLLAEADEVVTVETPPHFGAVGQFYEVFDQVSDERARSYLAPGDDGTAGG